MPVSVGEDVIVRATLTFDNGPDPDVTPRVLDSLAARGLRAMFFLVGSMLDDTTRPLAERALDEGHLIGNHSLTHRVPLGDDPDPVNVRREILEMEDRLGSLNERRLFRPFGGGGHLGPHLLDRTAVEILCDGGFTCVLWNAVPRDWEDPDGWVDVALAQCRAQDHAVVVLHDLRTGAMDHLDEFLDRLQGEGADITIDLPDDVTPIVGGKVRSLDGMVAG